MKHLFDRVEERFPRMQNHEPWEDYLHRDRENLSDEDIIFLESAITDWWNKEQMKIEAEIIRIKKSFKVEWLGEGFYNSGWSFELNGTVYQTDGHGEGLWTGSHKESQISGTAQFYIKKPENDKPTSREKQNAKRKFLLELGHGYLGADVFKDLAEDSMGI